MGGARASTALLACSFWLVDNLILQRRVREARAMFERLLAFRNDVGLLAEEYDPRTRRQMGNFPQASATSRSSTPLTISPAPRDRQKCAPAGKPLTRARGRYTLSSAQGALQATFKYQFGRSPPNQIGARLFLANMSMFSPAFTSDKHATIGDTLAPVSALSDRLPDGGDGRNALPSR